MSIISIPLLDLDFYICISILKYLILYIKVKIALNNQLASKK